MISGKFIGFTVAISCTIFSSCKKFELPEEGERVSSVFYAKGLLNDEPFAMEVDGIASEAISSWSEDSLGVYSYIGKLQNPGCSSQPCGPALEVRIRGEKDIDAGIKTGSYAYRHAATDVTVVVEPEFLGTALSYDWQFNGDSGTNAANEPLVFVIKSDFEKEYPIRLVAHFAGGCTSVIEDYIYLPSHGCSADIGVTQLDSNHLLFHALPTGQQAYKYSWTFESGPTASSKEVNYFFGNPPADGVEDVLLTIEGNGCVARKRLKQVVNPESVNCNVNLSYYTYSVPAPASPDLHTVEVIYTDNQGKTYESRTVEQPGWTRFTILSSEDYHDPVVEPVKRSKKISATLDVRLLSLSSDSTIIELRNVEMVLPVGLGL